MKDIMDKLMVKFWIGWHNPDVMMDSHGYLESWHKRAVEESEKGFFVAVFRLPKGDALLEHEAIRAVENFLQEKYPDIDAAP